MTDADERQVERADTTEEAWDGAAPGGLAGEEPDVLLDVAELRVDEISLEVQDLRARVSLEADVLELLKLHVGVDAALGRVQLTIKGVEAKVLLKVHLDNVARILDRVLTTIDNNPDIVERLTEPLGHAVEDAGHAVGDLGAAAGSAVEDLGEEARTAVADVMDEEAAPPRRGERDAEAKPRRRRSESTRKTSRRSRDRRPEER
jgi:hypothetical protein